MLAEIEYRGSLAEGRGGSYSARTKLVRPTVHIICWMKTGPKPLVLFTSDASNRLRELLEEKSVLVVIDDVWREADARPFLVGGKKCEWLLRTRVRATLPLGGAEVAVDEMSPAEASAVLVAGLPNEDHPLLDSEITKLAASLGEWPLLLNLVNRILIDRVKRRGDPTIQSIGCS